MNNVNIIKGIHRYMNARDKFLIFLSRHWVDYFMNLEKKTVVLLIMNLALMKFSLLLCGLKHTSFFFISCF